MPSLEIDRAHFYYEESGTGPPMLLIHGTGGHTGTFTELAPRLADAHRVITYDRRGHSRTRAQSPKRNYVRRHAEDAAALLRTLDATPAVIVGWSFGAIVALALAIDHPASVERVVLYEPPLHAKKHITLPMASAIGGAILLGKLGMHRRGAMRFMRWALARRDGTSALADLDSAMRESLFANARAIIAELEAGTGEELTKDDFAKVACPVTFILGGRSQQVFEDAASRFRSARVVHVPQGDHIMNIRQPELFATAIRDAMRETATAESS